MNGDAIPNRDVENEIAKKCMRMFQLSVRETDVLRPILAGNNNTEIQSVLFISNSTLKKHLNSIYRKMNVKGRAEMLRKIQETISSDKYRLI